MPYLTRVPINPRRSGSMSMLSNPHRLHGAVAAGIPSDPRAERLLWRLETTDPFRPAILVLSHTEPNYIHMQEQYGWPDIPAGAPVTKNYAPLLERLAADQTYRFRLTANPVQSTRRPVQLTKAQQQRQAAWDAQAGTAAQKKARGHRLAHRTAAHQRRWLIEKAERCGFDIPRLVPVAPTIPVDEPEGADSAEYQFTLVERKRLQFRRHREGKPVILNTATFEGLLRITDLDRFKHALIDGIGPSKAYGQGLLTLAPLASRES